MGSEIEGESNRSWSAWLAVDPLIFATVAMVVPRPIRQRLPDLSARLPDFRRRPTPAPPSTVPSADAVRRALPFGELGHEALGLGIQHTQPLVHAPLIKRMNTCRYISKRRVSLGPSGRKRRLPIGCGDPSDFKLGSVQRRAQPCQNFQLALRGTRPVSIIAMALEALSFQIRWRWHIGRH
jgi:hypothetical protein